MITGKLTAGLVLAALLLGAAAGWTAQGWRADAAASKVHAEQSKQGEAQAQQAQAAIETKAVHLLQHGAYQQENTHVYTQKISALESSRAVDAMRIAGLQQQLRSTATAHAQAASDAAACRDLADQHQRLAALAERGAGVVGGLGGLVKKRDAQVDLLRGQIDTDSVLLGRK